MDLLNVPVIGKLILSSKTQQMLFISQMLPLACSNSESINPFRHFGGTPWTVHLDPLQGLCLHTTAQHRKKGTYIHA